MGSTFSGEDNSLREFDLIEPICSRALQDNRALKMFQPENAAPEVGLLSQHNFCRAVENRY
jgi:hypothetical protein